MANVLIDIPDETYEYIKQNYRYGIGAEVASKLGFAVAEGTVLPKGHGRLIDADAINIHDVSPAYGMEVYGVTQDDIEYEPTVIEADKDVSE